MDSLRATTPLLTCPSGTKAVFLTYAGQQHAQVTDIEEIWHPGWEHNVCSLVPAKTLCHH